MARKNASKLSAHDLTFIAAAVKQDRTYNLGAMIAQHLALNREKGSICGGLMASRLLAFHGVAPHALDLAFSSRRLDLNSMIQHQFVSPDSEHDHLLYEISFWKKARRVIQTNRTLKLPAPLLDFSGRRSLSLLEPELDAYIAEQDQQAEGGGG